MLHSWEPSAQWKNVNLDQSWTFYKNLHTYEGNFSDEECDLFSGNLEIPTLMDEVRDNQLKVHWHTTNAEKREKPYRMIKTPELQWGTCEKWTYVVSLSEEE